MADCPNCETELEREEDAEHHHGCVGTVRMRLGYVLYCPECGYQERHIAGQAVDVSGLLE